ncbi:hypothetical protein Leryth_004607 [Lithospermum erythrorhizon]|nr:hypothetical protein Leryth_004607 [Lithospermum erythrorhizon]
MSICICMNHMGVVHHHSSVSKSQLAQRINLKQYFDAHLFGRPIQGTYIFTSESLY